MTERRQPCPERAVAAQITPFGRGSDGQSDDQVAAHNGGSVIVLPDHPPSLTVMMSIDVA
jgi:hypothetical protein